MLTDFLLKKLDVHVFKISVLKSLKAAVQFKYVFVCNIMCVCARALAFFT